MARYKIAKTGEELLARVDRETGGLKERFLLSDVMRFLEDPNVRKVLCLYGLRRTGKTFLIYQAIGRLSRQKKKAAYLVLDSTILLSDVYKEIELLVSDGYRYIFIDEITYVNGFLQSASRLADRYAESGTYIVLAGTDSYLLKLAKNSTLYDRVVLLSTTYISYKETCHLLGDISVLDYLRIGGVLPKDILCDTEKTDEYVETAISENIIHSIEKANNRKEYGHLLELNDRGLLKKAIEAAIARVNTELFVSILTEVYSNWELGSAMQLLAKDYDVEGALGTKGIEDIEDKVRYYLRIVKKDDSEFDNSYLKELEDFLALIHVFRYYKMYVNNRVLKDIPLYLQPGLHYKQLETLIEAVESDGSFLSMPADIRQALLTKIKEDTEGNILEHTVKVNCIMSLADRKDSFVTEVLLEGKEIDMVIVDGENIDLYEVKRSSKVVARQYDHLLDEEMNTHILSLFGMGGQRKIRDRCVLYMGDDVEHETDKGTVLYRNVSGFLRSLR